MMNQARMPLEGLRVLDIATMMAAPWAGTYLADFGADVIKVEHPQKGDTARNYGAKKNGISLFWKTIGRNKKSITLDIRSEKGKEIFLKLVKGTDILLENFRPGTMEKWGLDWSVLSSVNPRLIWVRCSGFGQDGPYASRGGFGTVAEAMSGFAYVNGYPDSPPTLPPMPLADGVCSTFIALAAMLAVYERDVLGSGQGQIIDISLYEPLMRYLESAVVEYSVLGTVPQRYGNRLPTTAPRNLYRTKDDKWIALSASAQPVAEKVFRAIGREDLITDPRFCDNQSRVKNVDELDVIIGGWIGERTLEEALGELLATGAVVGPVYDMQQIFEDVHYKYRGSLVEFKDAQLGRIMVPNVFCKFSRTPGQVKHLGTELGAHNEEIYGQRLGLSKSELEDLKKSGVI